MDLDVIVTCTPHRLYFVHVLKWMLIVINYLLSQNKREFLLKTLTCQLKFLSSDLDLYHQ